MSDHFVRAFHDTYGLPVVLTHSSNNYGPGQSPEKLLPLMIECIRRNEPLPVYGTGENVRDWLYVEDNARAIDAVFHRGRDGESYNIGGGNEWRKRPPHHLRPRSPRPRPPLRAGLHQAPPRTRLETRDVL